MERADDILEDYARKGINALMRRNIDLRLGLTEEKGSMFILKGSRAVCQVTFWYKGYFARVIDWAATVRESERVGLAVNVNDDSPNCRLIKRHPECVNTVETRVQKALDGYRLSPPYSYVHPF